MTLMSLPEVRQNIETGLLDAALQRIMDAVEQDIDQRHGAVDSQVDDLEGGLKSIWTTRPILTITSIVETVIETDTTLAADDYETRHNRQLDRLDSGTNARTRWGDRVKITYVPIDTTARRITVYLKLILLDIMYSGLDNSREGDFASSGLDYYTERGKILSGLSEPGNFI